MEVDFSDAIRRFESDLINGDIIMASRLEAYEAMFLSSHSPAVYRVGEPLFLELLDTGLQIVDLLIQAKVSKDAKSKLIIFIILLVTQRVRQS